MKTIVSILTILLCMASPSYAQLIAKDSTGVMAISLDEVTIQARSIIEKGDSNTSDPESTENVVQRHRLIRQITASPNHS